MRVDFDKHKHKFQEFQLQKPSPYVHIYTYPVTSGAAYTWVVCLKVSLVRDKSFKINSNSVEKYMNLFHR